MVIVVWCLVALVGLASPDGLFGTTSWREWGELNFAILQ